VQHLGLFADDAPHPVHNGQLGSFGTSQSGYLFFILPALAYLVLFVVFDMKMLFLVWRSSNLRNLEDPQLVRKKLTTFYIQFCTPTTTQTSASSSTSPSSTSSTTTTG
jgi:hypothetical protein